MSGRTALILTSLLLALFLGLYFGHVLCSPSPAWIEIEPGVGADSLRWHPEGPAVRTGPDGVLDKATQDAAQVRVRVGFTDNSVEEAILEHRQDTGEWVRLQGSGRIAIDPREPAVRVAPAQRLVFLLGILGMLQVLFLPGFLVLKALKIRTPAMSALVLSFGLSLLCNSYLVMVLWALKIYSPAVLGVVAVAEVLLLGLVARQWDLAGALARSARSWRSFLEFAGSLPVWQRACWAVLMAGALAGIGWALADMVQTTGEAFTAWDAVHSWNRWALAFAANEPVAGGLYPQLLPKNLSIPYVMAGEPGIEFFSRALMPFFPLAMLAGMFDLGLKSRNPGFLLAVPLSAYLMHAFLGPLVTAGYADVPVAFLGYAGLHALFLGRLRSDPAQRRKALLLSAALFAGTALTKQAGLIYVLAGPLLARFLLFDEPTPERGKSLLRAGLLSVVLAAPGYAFNLLLMALGKLGHNLVLLTQTIHGGRNGWERLVFSLDSLRAALGPYCFWLVYPGSLAAAFRRGAGVLVWGLVAPYFLFWALLFSYNLRNFTLSIPPTALAVGLGLAALARLDKATPASDQTKQEQSAARPLLNGWTLACAALAAALLVGSALHKDRLLAMQDTASMRVMFPGLNEKLAESYADGLLEPPLLTNVYHLAKLPILRERLAAAPEDDPLRSVEDLETTLAKTKARSILYRPRAVPAEVAAGLDALVREGEWLVAWEYAPEGSELLFRLLARQDGASP